MELTIISYLLLLFANIGAAVYIHIADGLCVDLYDSLNMVGGIPATIKICGESLEAACGTGGDGDGSISANNPYDCKDCEDVMIYGGFKYNVQEEQGTPTCQGNFTFPEDYGDVYYAGEYLYDASGNQIGDASCDEAVEWGGNFLNPWNSWPSKTQPSITPCPSPASPAPVSATCYHAADPDACPYQYEVGWCYCNNEAAMYPILSGSDPCGYTVLPTTTTTSPLCTATE